MVKYLKLALPLTLACLLAWSYLLLQIRTSQLNRETAEHQATQLTALGMKRATPRHTSSLGEGDSFVEKKREEVRKVGAHPIVAVVAESGQAVIELPLPSVPCVPSIISEGGTPIESTLASIVVQARVSALLASTDAGEVYGDGQVAVTLHSQGDVTGARTAILPITDGKFETSKDMQQALRDYYTRSSRIRFSPRKPREWRIGLTAGVGACLSQDIRPCAFAGIGAQF